MKNSTGVASIYSRARGPTGRTVSSSGAVVQTAIGMGDCRGRCGVPWRYSKTWFRGVGRCGLVWNMRRSARQRRRLLRRAVAVHHGAANEDVWWSPGSVGIVYARGKGGARSVGFGRGWRSGARSAWSLAVWARSVRVVQGLATLAAGTVSGGGQWVASQTCWLGLLLLLACCRLWGGKGVLGCSPLMAMASSQWC